MWYGGKPLARNLTIQIDNIYKESNHSHSVIKFENKISKYFTIEWNVWWFGENIPGIVEKCEFIHRLRYKLHNSKSEGMKWNRKRKISWYECGKLILKFNRIWLEDRWESGGYYKDRCLGHYYSCYTLTINLIIINACALNEHVISILACTRLMAWIILSNALTSGKWF